MGTDTDVYYRLSRALDGHLNLMSALPAIAWPNTSFKPTVGELWLRPTILPAESFPASIGIYGTNRLSGVYQIDIFSPLDAGRRPSVQMVDDIIEHFSRGLTIEVDNLVVHIEESWPSASNAEETWYHTPVNVNWYSYSER